MYSAASRQLEKSRMLNLVICCFSVAGHFDSCQESSRHIGHRTFLSCFFSCSRAYEASHSTQSLLIEFLERIRTTAFESIPLLIYASMGPAVIDLMSRQHLTSLLSRNATKESTKLLSAWE